MLDFASFAIFANLRTLISLALFGLAFCQPKRIGGGERGGGGGGGGSTSGNARMRFYLG